MDALPGVRGRGSDDAQGLTDAVSGDPQAWAPLPRCSKVDTMRTYRRIWVIMGALLAVGGIAGLVKLQIVDIILLALMFGALGGWLYSTVHHRADHPAGRRQIARAGVEAAAGGVAGAGLIALLGGTAFLLLVLFAVASPWSVGMFRKAAIRFEGREPGAVPGPRSPIAQATPPRRRRKPAAAPEPEGRTVPSAPTMPNVTAMTIGELCQAWRHSFTVLAKSNAGGRLRVVELRQACLDELQVRDPAGFARWLGAGARAASDPSRFLLSSDAHSAGGRTPPADGE